MEKIKLQTQSDILDFIEYLNATTEWERLADKTQVFNVRVEDAIKTRGSHSIDVGEIAAQMASKLTSDPIEIEKARLLGRLHDIGHIPFGHAGESIADKIISSRAKGKTSKEKQFTEEEKQKIFKIRECLFGKSYTDKNKKICFEHNENSVLQYYLLSEELGFEIDPEIVEGILAHSTSRYLDLPPTLAQQSVRLADKIAYINYDTQDLQLSFQGKIEWEALQDIYKRPILDSEGKATVIEYNGKQYTNVLEFLEGLSVSDRIALFIDEAIRMAKEDKARNDNSKYTNYQTILTGGNDIIVAIAQLKKNPIYYNKEKKEWTPEGKIEEAKYKKKLMEKSPILYLAYEMKERSDEFIRAGTGLPLEAQKERSENAKSAVGNEDLKNQYIYDKLVTFIENRDKLKLDEIPESLRSVFVDYFKRYEEYKERQEKIIANLPGNDQKIQYPEIFTILNFIGLHSNSELNELAKHLGINLMFKQEVLPKIQALLSNKEMYDEAKGIFTEKGLEERDKIVDKYGAHMVFRYGMEEDDMTPTTSREVEIASHQYGYSSELSQEKTLTPTKEIPQETKMEDFSVQKQKTDSAVLEVIKEHSNAMSYEMPSSEIGRGR